MSVSTCATEWLGGPQFMLSRDAEFRSNAAMPTRNAIGTAAQTIGALDQSLRLSIIFLHITVPINEFPA